VRLTRVCQICRPGGVCRRDTSVARTWCKRRRACSRIFMTCAHEGDSGRAVGPVDEGGSPSARFALGMEDSGRWNPDCVDRSVGLCAQARRMTVI